MNIDSCIYKIDDYKIQVILSQDEDNNSLSVQGSICGILELGGSDKVKTIKQAIKLFCKVKNFFPITNIKHSIYGIYSCKVQ